ncbi:hypothetical protein CS379_01650, partial [Methylobacterium frigidaeris]
MPLMNFGHCWRGRTDCTSFTSVEHVPPGTTEDQFYDLAFTPESFVCCGCVAPEARTLPQDAYRVCFKNAASDEMTDNDEQDIAHLAHVLNHTLATVATRRLQQPTILVPHEMGMTEVPTAQHAEATKAP